MASLLFSALALMLTNSSVATRRVIRDSGLPAPHSHSRMLVSQSNLTTTLGDKRATSACCRLLVRLPVHALPPAVPLIICLQTVTGTVPKPVRSRRKAAAAPHPFAAPPRSCSSKVAGHDNHIGRKHTTTQPPGQRPSDRRGAVLNACSLLLLPASKLTRVDLSLIHI